MKKHNRRDMVATWLERCIENRLAGLEKMVERWARAEALVLRGEHLHIVISVLTCLKIRSRAAGKKTRKTNARRRH